MTIYRYGGHILKSNDGHIANDLDCCCGSEPCNCGSCKDGVLYSDCPDETYTRITGSTLTISGATDYLCKYATIIETSAPLNRFKYESLQFTGMEILNGTYVHSASSATATVFFLGTVTARFVEVNNGVTTCRCGMTRTGNVCCSGDVDVYLSLNCNSWNIYFTNTGTSTVCSGYMTSLAVGEFPISHPICSGAPYYQDIINYDPPDHFDLFQTWPWPACNGSEMTADAPYDDWRDYWISNLSPADFPFGAIQTELSATFGGGGGAPALFFMGPDDGFSAGTLNLLFGDGS